MPSPRSLDDVLRALKKEHGRVAPPPARGAFQMALWEAVAYLVDDEVRLQVFRSLEKEVGLAPAALAAAGAARVAKAIAAGGMQPAMRAEKVMRAADIALEIGPEELQQEVEAGTPRARKMLERFPGIGRPGAEKILMAHGAARTLAPDSNGLRVLVRLGFAPEKKDYAATYRTMAEALAPELPTKAEALLEAHLLLRLHGQTLCRRTSPACERCPLSGQCAFAGGAERAPEGP
jgi:endonuclease-3